MSLRFPALVPVFLSLLWLSGTAAADPAAVARLVKDGEAMLDRWTGERGVLIEADKKINAALKLNPKSSAALVQRGRLLMMAGWEGEELLPEAKKAAEEAFLAAEAADPKSPQPLMLLGHFYTVTKDLPRARRSLIRAELLGSTDPWLYLNWAAYYAASDEPLKELDMAEKALATGKANTKAQTSAYLRIMRLCATVKRDRKRADEAYDALIALHPAGAYTRGDYARHLLFGLKDFVTAEALAMEALAIMQYPHAMQTLSMALYGQWGAAIDRNAPAAEVAKLYAKASAFDPKTAMIPECAAGEPAMASVVKHLAARKAPVVPSRQRC